MNINIISSHIAQARLKHFWKIGILLGTPMIGLVDCETGDGSKWMRIVWRIMWKIS